MFDNCDCLVLCLIVPLALAGLSAMAEEDARVKTWEGAVTLPTYTWYDDVNPVFAAYEGRIYYPYTRQEYIADVKTPRNYRALFLESDYLKLTCLPELGGRIYSVLDKSTGEEMFHRNDEIKPALIAMRGAWISGGIEWNAGPQGHTVTIVGPVDALVLENEDGSATLVVGNTEKMFRTRWTVRLTLHPGKAYLDEEIRIYNPTDGTHPYYFWNCTAFPNRPGTRFIYPMTLGTNHSGTEFFSWPVHKGRDISWLKNYDTMTSIFAYECAFDFFGAYDADRDRGIVSYANHHVLKGKKAWTWGQDDFAIVSQMSLSDAGPKDAPYIEVQSGPLLTQADYGMLKPQRQIAWREAWYPVHGLDDGFEYATRDAAVQVHRTGEALELRILATGEFPGAECRLTQKDNVLVQCRVDLSPRRPASVLLPSPPEGPIDVTIRSGEGSPLLVYSTPLDIPQVTPPDETAKPARPDGQPTADEKFLAAALGDSQSNPEQARQAYEAALAIDPQHAASLCALATLDIECGRFADAEKRARTALERDPASGEAWYLLGVARLHQDDFSEAMACGYKAANTLEAVSLGYTLAGRASMCMGDYPGAVEAFAHARRVSPEAPQIRNYWLLARHAAGDRDGLARDIPPITAHDDPTDFIARAVHALEGPAPMHSFLEDVGRIAGEKEFVVLEAATFLAGVRLYAEAARLLESCIETPAPFAVGPMPYYYLAYYEDRRGNSDNAQRWLERAAGQSADYAFPSRPEAIDALQFAVETRPNDAHAQLLLGHACAGLGRIEEALPHWQKAAEIDPTLSTAWRLIGLHAWKKQVDLAAAERAYRNALAARPADPLLYRDLAHILEGQDRRPEAIALIERMPRDRTMRYEADLWLAQAYLSEQRYDECIALLETTRFSNWEGQTTPHDIFVSALLARGKGRFDAGKFEAGLADLERALTYPENLEVGASYKATDAEIRYWLGKALLALDRADEARAAWENGAGQVTSADPPLPFISVSAAQDEYVKRCATALEVLNLS